MTELYRAEAAGALAHLDALGKRMERLVRENVELRAELEQLRAIVNRGQHATGEFPTVRSIRKTAG